jgi:hypothetical protein
MYGKRENHAKGVKSTPPLILEGEFTGKQVMALVVLPVCTRKPDEE